MDTTPTKTHTPSEDNAHGPQNSAERQLYELIKEGANSGPSSTTSIKELTDELRHRIRSKRNAHPSASALR